MPRAVVLEPPASLDDLAKVTAGVLVLAQADDSVHPVKSAEQLVSALPNARLVVSDAPWIWGGRSALRREVSEFLNR